MLGLCLALLLAASRQQNQDVHVSRIYTPPLPFSL